MKVTLIQACDKLPKLKVGDSFDIQPDEFEAMYDNKLIVTASEYESSQRIIKGREKVVDDEITLAIDRGVILPKDETKKSELRARALKLEEAVPGAGIDIIRAINGGVGNALLTQRLAPANNDYDQRGLIIVDGDIRAAGSRYVELKKNQNDILRGSGGQSKETVKEAIKLSAEAGIIMKARFFDGVLHKGGNLRMSECLKASDDVAGTDVGIGTLNTGIVLMRNLGFLKNMLTFLNKISTDLRNEPVLFGQNVLTRYITPPNVLTYVPGIGQTSDQSTINAWKNTITAANPAGTTLFGTGGTVGNIGTTLATSAGGGAQYSGTQFVVPVVGGSTVATKTLSAPSATDVNVVLNNYQAVEITFNNVTVSSTLRNPFAEQQGASMYSLAETINLALLSTLYQAKWSPKTGNPAFSLCGGNDPVSVNGVNPMGLSNIIAVKNQFSLNKMPSVSRFALLQSVYHDAILTDSNLLNAKAILALLKKDTSEFESGELPQLFGVDVLESQLSSGSLTAAAGATSTATFTDTALTSATGVVGQLGNTRANACIGFAGNQASSLFVARIPQDYTKVIPDIPATAAIEIVTEPDAGLSMLLVKYISHNLEQTYVRAGLMYNFAQGDPRQGFILTP